MAKTSPAKTATAKKLTADKTATGETAATKSRGEKLSTMSLLSHLLELRRRLFWCLAALLIAFFGCYYFAKDIYGWLAEPLFAAWQQQGGDGINHKMIATNLTEIFFTNVRLAFYAAVIVAMPFLLLQLWLFIAPGLYRHEKKSFAFFLFATPFFFLLGAAFVYFLVIPTAWDFFLSFEQFNNLPTAAGNMAVQIQPKVSDYLSLVLQLVLAFGLSFETPVLLILLLQLGVITRAWLIKHRRYAIVIAFIIAGVLTPPDPLSQVSLAVPLILLYELAIAASYFMKERKATK
ncbi:MAG: twin-arginine translocase subunit TatC [Hydrotalea sp.]|nr:twin-arginine translocase subunit TatC [Hydrotalea sp.]